MCPTLCDPMNYIVHGILQARLLEWVGSHSLLQGIFPTQELNSDLPHCGWILYQMSHQGSPLKIHLSLILKCLLLGRKVMTNLDSIFKSRDITLPTKVWLVKAMVFPVVTYGCESWTVKKAELRRIDAFELWCWRRLLRVPWTARRSALGFLWKE